VKGHSGTKLLRSDREKGLSSHCPFKSNPNNQKTSHQAPNLSQGHELGSKPYPIRLWGMVHMEMVTVAFNQCLLVKSFWLTPVILLRRRLRSGGSRFEAIPGK
jgi:hypothetical protein